MSTPNRTRAAIYTRVSTDDQAHEGYGLGDQENRGREVAARQGWTVTVYSDPGRSGADRDRPGLHALLAAVEAGELDVVWFDSQDRLARDVGHTADLVATFIAADVEVWERFAPIDLSDDGQAQVDLKALFAAWERRKIRRRTKHGIAARARTSGKPWGAPKYGYRRTESGDWKPDPVEAPVLQRIFRMRVERGMAKAAIARQLTREGIPTRKGVRWSATVVSTVLRGREGLGEFHHGGEWHRGRHSPLIDEQQWAAAQALDEQGRKYAPGAAGRLPERHLFVRGMLRCACGAAMLPRSARDQADHYVCRTHKADAAACPMPPVRRERIDSAALEMFEEVALDVEATREHLVTQLDAQAAETRALAARAAREVAELDEQASRVEADYRRGALPAEAYARLVTSIAEERQAGESNAQRLSQRLTEVEAKLANVDAEHETLTRLAELRTAIADRMNASGDIEALRAALAAVCAEVRLHSVEDGMFVLDYIPVDDEWRRVGIALEASAARQINVSGSGVPL